LAEAEGTSQGVSTPVSEPVRKPEVLPEIETVTTPVPETVLTMEHLTAYKAEESRAMSELEPASMGRK
jgi:hypothetical protein